MHIIPILPNVKAFQMDNLKLLMFIILVSIFSTARLSNTTNVFW